MTRRWLERTAVVTVATMLCAVPGLVHASGQATGAVGEFQRAVQEYTQLERHIDAALGEPEVSGDAEMIQQRVEDLAAALRQARSTARRGDLFTPAVSALFRERIHRALVTSGYQPADVLRALAEETSYADPPVVNGRFAWTTAAPMLPCILLALPELPEMLQYRFVRGDLVLVDTNANLIVDVLPAALAPALTS